MQAQLARGGKSAIYSAMLKYGICNFSLYILEYCEKSKVLEIEQKYIDLYKPEYNILRLAGSSRGHKVSDETKARMSKASRGRVVSDESRKRIAAGLGTPVVVLDLLTNASTEYVSIADAARFFKVYTKKIYRCVLEKKLYLDRYQILLVGNPGEVVDECSQVAFSPKTLANLDGKPSDLGGQHATAGFLLNTEPFYMYDTKTKKCIHKADNPAKFSASLNISFSNLNLFLDSLQPYLGRFILSTIPLSSNEYAENFLDTETLLDLVKSAGSVYRQAILKNLTSAQDSAKPQHELKRSKQIQITDIKTYEVFLLDSPTLAAKFVRTLDPAFRCTISSISECIIKGRTYKKTFKFEVVPHNGQDSSDKA